MYLLVFITMVVALIGIYAEVLQVQTKQLFSHQTTVAVAMQQWQSTAVGVARYAITSAPSATGCSLLNTNSFPGTSPCSATVDGGQGSFPTCTSPPVQASGCWISGLPPGYQTSAYKFYSIFYQPAAGGEYIVTFVLPPSNPASGLITLANGAQLGLTMSDLLGQIRNLGMSPIAYGIVNSSGQLVTPGFSTDATTNTSFSYTLPAVIGITAGTVGMITSL